MAVEVGQNAPDFTLTDTDRKQRKLSEFQGKNVVLAFFPGAFTGVCTKEACAFRDNAAQLNSMNAQVVGVAVDSFFALKGWSDVNKLAFPLLSDHTRQVINQYGVSFPNFGMQGYTSATRAVFVLDKTGKVQYRWIGQPGNDPPHEEIHQALAKLPK